MAQRTENDVPDPTLINEITRAKALLPSNAKQDALIWLSVYAASIQGMRTHGGYMAGANGFTIRAESDARLALDAWNSFVGGYDARVQ